VTSAAPSRIATVYSCDRCDQRPGTTFVLNGC
jgi:hypothetical protein